MRAVNASSRNTKISTHTMDDLFILSIRKIVDDILLKEMKEEKEIKAIAIISPFSNDGKSEISDHLSSEFAALGSKTLLLSLQGTQAPGDVSEGIPSETLTEDSIVRTGIKNLDYLSLDELRKAYGFTVDKASLGSLLNQLKSRYKRIIIDTPSLDRDVAGFMAAGTADGVYFICSRKNMRSGELERYYRNLKEIGAGILGIIYNNAEQKTVKKAYIKNGQKYG